MHRRSSDTLSYNQRMPLSNEKIAEIQTLAELLGVQSTPNDASINMIYEKHLSRLNAPQESEDPDAERDRNRIVAQRLENFKRNR
jgi:hypothetical protein